MATYHSRRDKGLQSSQLTQTLTSLNGVFDLPSNLYFIEEGGVTTQSDKVVEEIERDRIAYLKGSSAAPTATHPVYESLGDRISVLPSTIEAVNLRYLRKPLKPNWTYVSVGGDPLFNISDNSYQDFELHASEFSNIVGRVVGILWYNIKGGSDSTGC